MDKQSDILEIVKAPVGLKLFPVIMASGYFTWSYFWKKHELGTTAAMTGVIFLVAAFPWLSYKKAVMPALKQQESPSLSVAVGIEQQSKGRKSLINDICDIEESLPKSGILASRENRIAALQTLTNDELNLLYVFVSLVRDKDKLAPYMEKYKGLSSEAATKNIAKELYGIDLSAISNLTQTYAVLMAKVEKKLATNLVLN